MQYRLLNTNNLEGHSDSNPRLILFFAGWAMDDKPFAHLARPGYDIAVIWDYRNLHIDWSFTRPYSEICILAWSMGVYAATITTQAIDYKVTARIAVNGTITPIHNTHGIPEAIYHGTLDGLSERNLLKFYRRVCGSAQAYKDFCLNIPQRPLDQLRDELAAIETHSILANPVAERWDLAIISRDDAIFPPVNQFRAWDSTPRRMLPAPHLLDFQKIIDRYFIDKPLVGKRFSSGRPTYDLNAPVQQFAISKLEEMMQHNGLLKEILSKPLKIIEIGSGTGALSRRIAAWSPLSAIEMWDLSDNDACLPPGDFVCCDAETAIWQKPKQSADIIASASTLQWFNSPARFLDECHRVLAPGGYLLITTYIDGNLREIRQATGRSLPLLTDTEWQLIARKAGFDVIDEHSCDKILDFDTPLDALRHLKMTGVNALGRSRDSIRAARQMAERMYPMLDGLYHLTYRPYIAILKKQ